MPRITKRVVDAAAPHPDPKKKIRYVWDADVIGFGLAVRQSGAKIYFYRYRTPEGRERRATIGRHGTWTPDQARRRAEELREAVRTGSDPAADKRALRQAPTVGQVLDAYLDSERFKSKAPSTQAIDRGRIGRHLKPTLGRKHVHLLTPGDVERARASIRDGKTAANVKTGKPRGRARVTGGAGAARMAIQLLRSILNWAEGEGLAASNPAARVKTGASGTRETILEDVAGYARLFSTLDTMQHERRIRAPAADAIRLIALTGARRGEIAWLRWSHVDLKRGLLTLPPAEHKTGRRTGRPRVIGLPAAAQAVVARQPAGDADALVFAPAKGEGPIALSKVWCKVRAEAELPEGIGLHGLRHSFATHMAMQGAEAAEIMAALGHSQLSTASRYLHWARDARQALAERGAATALAGMAASSGGTQAAMIKLPAGRK